MSGRRLRPMEAISATIGSESIGRFELLEEISRWFFNSDHHFFDDDGNDQISMKMIVRTKEAFELNYKRGKTIFAQKVVCAPPSSIAALSSRLPCCSVSSLLDQVIMIMRGW